MDANFVKDKLIGVLENAGIPESKISIKFPKKPKNNWLGWYRNMSQFSSHPIIYVDLERHISVLKDMNDLSENNFIKNVMDTVLHEYGHVIEEFVRLDARRTKNYSFQKIIEKEFDDYEDFAELFAKYVNKDVWIDDNKFEAIEVIIDFYKNKVFEPVALDWVKQEPWKRELDILLKSHAKSLKYCESQEGSFNKCKKTCEALLDRFSDGLDIQIVRCEGFKGSLSEANKWKSVSSNDIVHYVLAVGDKIIDLTAKQFNEKELFPKITSKMDFEKEWDEISLYKQKTLNKLKKIPSNVVKL